MDIDEWVESVDNAETDKKNVESNNNKVDEKKPINLMNDWNKKVLKENLVRQLMKDCPPTRDFYYLTCKIRSETDPVRAKELLGQLYPKYRFGVGQDEDDGINGDVDKITNALGHVKVASRTAPRKLLDPEVMERVVEKMDCRLMESNDRSAVRDILYKIEKLYQALIVFEETIARALILEYASGFDRRTKEDAEEYTMAVLNDEVMLNKILVVEKGVNVVCRWMKHLKPARVLRAFVSILCQLQNVSELDERRAKRAYNSLIYFTSEFTEEQYLQVIQDLPGDVLPGLMKTQLGISLVILLLTRGSVFCRGKKAPNVLVDEFSAFFRAVTEVFSENDVSLPLEFYTCFLDNLLQNSTYGGEEYRDYWKYLHDDYFAEVGCEIIEKPAV